MAVKSDCLDSGFLALSVAFILLGTAGIVLFAGPLTPSGDSCYCAIPSPEPGAAQGTSSIILALGVMFFPMGLLKGGLPSFGRGPAPPPVVIAPGGRVVTPVPILSGNFLLFGLVVVLVGIDAILVPGYLIYKNPWYELAGILMTAAGALAMLWGLRKPKTS
jgi:hypothetical protein